MSAQPNKHYNKTFNKIVENETDIVGLVAYAIYKYHKRFRISKFKEERGREPSYKELNRIINTLSDKRILVFFRIKSNQLLDATVDFFNDGNQIPLRSTLFRKDAPFEKLVEDESDVQGLLAYGIYKYNKCFEILNFKNENGRDPNRKELNDIVTVPNDDIMLELNLIKSGKIINEISGRLGFQDSNSEPNLAPKSEPQTIDADIEMLSNRTLSFSNPLSMDKTKIVIAIISAAVVLVCLWAIFHWGGKISLPNGASIEHVTTPTDVQHPEKTSSSVLLTGTLLIDGKAPNSDDVQQVYLKDNNLIQPVSLDGNAFYLENIPIGKLIHLCIDLKNGKRLSKTFALPTPKDGISNLGECLFFTSTSTSPESANKSKISSQVLNPQSKQKIEINNPIFNAPTQIGDYNTQINGLKPREVSDDLINDIVKQIPNNSTPIGVYQRSDDLESIEFASKIVRILISRGYKNAFVNGIVHDRIIGGDPEEAIKHQRKIAYKWEEGQFNIIIPGNK